jgi:hypothetical protein
VDTAHFSLACDSKTARLYIYWIGNDGTHYMKQIIEANLHSGFRKQNVNQNMAIMRMYLRNIRDWAMGDRLESIKDAVKIAQGRLEDEDAERQRIAAQKKIKGKGKEKVWSTSKSSSTVGFDGVDPTFNANNTPRLPLRNRGPPGRKPDLT